MTRSKHHILLSTGAAALLVLAACGSDDASSDSTDAPANSTATTDAPEGTTASTGAPVETTAAPDAPGGTDSPADSGAPVATDADGADVETACDAWIAADGAVIQFLFAGQGDADSVNAAIDVAIDSADPANLQTLTDLKEAAQPQLADPESDASDELLGLYSDSIAWAGASCPDVETIDVSAVDYHYEGIPTELTTGYKVLNFTNNGTEAHEIFAFRINDGVTDSVDELLALPEEEAFSKITPVNASFAMPGDSEVGSWDLTEPGNYAAVCFVSVGSVDGQEGEGPPHFTQGMIHEFTVTA